MNRQINTTMQPKIGIMQPWKTLCVKEEQANLGVLLEVGSIGAGHAATALSDILQQPVSIDVPKIRSIEPHLLPAIYSKHDTPTRAVYLQLLENYGCDILLMIELNEAKKIAAIMTMCASIDECTEEIETSAIQELANILIGSFLTAISDFTNVKLLPTTPQTITDSFDAILDNFLIRQSMTSKNALIFETRFKRAGEDAKSVLMIFPNEELKNLLTQKAKQHLKSKEI